MNTHTANLVLAEGGNGVPAEDSSDTNEVIPGPDEQSDRRSRGIWGVLAAVLIAAIALLLVLTQCAPRVPDVRGLSEKDATAELTRAGYALGTLSRTELPGTPVGRVGEQVPAAGAFLARGSSIDLLVAVGAEMVTVPDAVGMDTPAAELLMTRSKLAMDATGEYNPSVPPGAIISQEPTPGTTVRAGSEVAVVVSLGLEPAVAAGWDASSDRQASGVADDTDADPGSAGLECTASYPGASVWSSGGDIYIRLAPGGAAKQLTSGSSWDTRPLLSPSAKYVVFMRASSSGTKASDIGRICLTTWKSETLNMPISLHMKTGHVWYSDYAFGPSRTGTTPEATG